MSTQPVLPFGTEERKLPRLIESLAEVCRQHPLDEKVLIAPSRFVGHQIAEALARSGTPWTHLRVESVRSLAHSVAGLAIAEQGLTLLSRAQALALIEQACAETLTPESYFGELAARPGLHRAIQNTFDELRSAGISPAALPEAVFGDPRKVLELKKVLAVYEAALARGKFVDRPEVLRRAVDVLRGNLRPPDSLHLLAGSFELSATERELIDRISGGRLRMLETDTPESWAANAGRASLFRALGEENEIREILRRVLAEGVPLDDVEILATDPATYGPIVYELTEEHDVPCTFGGGVPATFTRPGQAALGFLRWLGRNFESEELREVVAGGLLDLTRICTGDPPGPIPAARELREARIGWGRERTLDSLDRHVARRAADIESTRRRSEEDEEDLAARIEWLEERLTTARAVRDLVRRLVSLAPAGGDTGEVELRAVARSASAFVAGFTRIAGDADAKAASALQGLFGELETLPVTRLPIAQASTRLADAVRSLHIAADRPRPGRLHLDDYRSGGYSGRSHVFFVGLDSRRHPGSGLQDPVLLDGERRGINAVLRPQELAMRAGRPDENVLAWKACVARVRGEITMSFPCWNLLEAREQFPAAIYLDVFRLASGRAGADYSDLDRGLDAPAGFLTEPRRALDETEWWLSRVQDPVFSGGRGAPAVRGAYFWLQDGFTAETQRESDLFTIFDGWIRDSAGLDPRTSESPTSCSRIQELARCPYSYFLKRVLRIQPPEDATVDPTVWLSAMQKGNLLHEVFRRFYADPAGAVVRTRFDRDWDRMKEIALEELAKWKEKIPPRSEAAFEALREDVLVACRTFVLREETHCRDVTPKWFEVGFGPSRDSTEPPGGPEPVRISLGAGQEFRLSGRIDRVDEESPDTYQVWDYKTGSPWDTADPKRGRGGRRIQDALYAQTLEILLAREGRPGRVVKSGYFYPGRRGEGERYDAPLDVPATRRTLTALFDLLREGAFPHTPTKEDCSICDFGKVCGSSDLAAGRAKSKLENVSGNPVLEPYRILNPS